MNPFARCLRWSGVGGKAAGVVALLLLFSVPAEAQTRITLQDAIDIALDRNIELVKAANQVEVSEQTVMREKGDFLPNLNASTGASRNWGLSFDQTSGSLVTEQSDAFNLSLNTGVNLFDGFSNIATLRSSQFQLEADKLTLERAEQAVFFNVIEAYLALLLSQEQIGIQAENVESQRQQLRRIEEFVRLGARPISDQYQQEAAVASAELALLNAERTQEINESRLIQVLELDPLLNYEFDQIDAETLDLAASSYDLDAMLSESLERRADVRSRDFLIKALEQDIRSAKGGVLPSLSLSGGVGSSYSSQRVERLFDGAGNLISSETIPFSDQISDNRSGRLGLNLSIPLFNRFQNKTNIHRTQITYENSKLDLENLKQTVALEVRQAYLDYETAVKRLDVTEKQLRSARQAEAVEQERYNVGASTLVELSGARATLVDAESQRAQAIYQFVFQGKVIDYYLGVLNPTDSVLPGQ